MSTETFLPLYRYPNSLVLTNSGLTFSSSAFSKTPPKADNVYELFCTIFPVTL